MRFICHWKLSILSDHLLQGTETSHSRLFHKSSKRNFLENILYKIICQFWRKNLFKFSICENSIVWYFSVTVSYLWEKPNHDANVALSAIDLLNCFLLPKRKIEYSSFFYNRYNYTSFNDIIFDTGFSAL